MAEVWRDLERGEKGSEEVGKKRGSRTAMKTDKQEKEMERGLTRDRRRCKVLERVSWWEKTGETKDKYGARKQGEIKGGVENFVKGGGRKWK